MRLLVTLGPQSGSHACATGSEQEAGPVYKISRSTIPTHFLYQGSTSCRLHNLPKQCYLLGKQVSEYFSLMGTFCIQIKTASFACCKHTFEIKSGTSMFSPMKLLSSIVQHPSTWFPFVCTSRQIFAAQALHSALHPTSALSLKKSLCLMLRKHGLADKTDN